MLLMSHTIRCLPSSVSASIREPKSKMVESREAKGLESSSSWKALEPYNIDNEHLVLTCFPRLNLKTLDPEAAHTASPVTRMDDMGSSKLGPTKR